MEWNGGMENGMEWCKYTIIANLCKLALFFKVEQAMMHLGILSHRSSCMSKSSVASIPSCLVSRSENNSAGDQLQYHAWGTSLLLLRKAATKFVRPIGVTMVQVRRQRSK